MKPYSKDLRLRVLAAVNRGMPRALVIYGRTSNSFAGLIETTETGICLVIIDVVACLSNERLMGTFGRGTKESRHFLPLLSIEIGFSYC